MSNRKSIIIASALLLLSSTPHISHAGYGDPCSETTAFFLPMTAMTITASLIGILSACAERIRPRACGALSSTAIGLLSTPTTWITISAVHGIFGCKNGLNDSTLPPIAAATIAALARTYTALHLH